MTRDDFAARVTAAQGRLYRVARGYLRQEADCLDAISEAIARAWHKLPTLRQEQYFDTWLTRILIRECVNVQRRQKRVTPVDALPESMAAADSGGEALCAALDELPQKLRMVAVLHYMEGYTVAETAQILRVPKGTVCSRLKTAREKLRVLLEEGLE